MRNFLGVLQEKWSHGEERQSQVVWNGSLHVSVGSDNEYLGRLSALIPPTMMNFRRNAGGIPSFETIQGFFQSEFDGPLQDDGELFCLTYIRT